MYTLFGFAQSSATQRVRTVLNLKGIAFKPSSINFTKGEQFSESYKAIHPRQVVPALQTPKGDVIVESLAICEYLEEVHPQYPLIPKDPHTRAKVRSICEFVNSSIQPYQHMTIFQYINKQSPDAKVSWQDQWTYWNQRGIQNLENGVIKTRGKYCVGDQLTLADILVYCQIDAAQTRFQIDFAKSKNVMEIYSNINEVEIIEKSRGVYLES